LEAETDYTGASSLDFTRTYRSTYGAFASVSRQTFSNLSLPAHTELASCYPGVYVLQGGITGSYCFPYISTGQAQYLLHNSDARTVAFAGPNSAVAANADVNERVTQVTLPDSSTGWQVTRDDDSAEVYDATGFLIKKVLRGGRSFTYTYSTASTPASIAPQAGLLLRKRPSGY
jgi:hypothetical protein